VAETLSQPFLDAVVTQLATVMPRRVRVRAWIGDDLTAHDRRWPKPWARSERQLPSVPLFAPWEPDPARLVVWIELRRRGFLFGERMYMASRLEDTNAAQVMEQLLTSVQNRVPEMWEFEVRTEISSDEIRWWYERQGNVVIEFEPLPLPDEPEDGEGESGVREPRRPLPNAPSAEAAIDPSE
jgi:hypothetical protein